jgi:hypothetical protein
MKKCKKVAGRKRSATVPVVRTKESTQEYDAGRKRHTRKRRKRLHIVEKTLVAGKRGWRTTTKVPTRKKVKPRKQAKRYDVFPILRRPSSTSSSTIRRPERTR